MSPSHVPAPPRRLRLLSLCLALATVALWWWSPGWAAYASASEGSAMHGLDIAADLRLSEPGSAAHLSMSATGCPQGIVAL